MHLFKLIFFFSSDTCPAGSYGSSIFNLLRSIHIIFHNDCTNLHSQQQCYKGSLVSTSFPSFIICDLLDDSHSDGVRWYLIVVLICIFLMISDVEHLFMCLLAFCMSSLAKCLFRSSAYFQFFFLNIELQVLFIYFGS